MRSRSREKTLTAQQLGHLNVEMGRRARSVVSAYVLFILLGGFGIHQFYLGRAGRALMFVGTLGLATILTLLTSDSLFDNTIYLPTKGDLADAGGQSLGGTAILIALLTIPGALLSIYDLLTLDAQTKETNVRIETEIVESLRESTRWEPDTLTHSPCSEVEDYGQVA